MEVELCFGILHDTLEKQLNTQGMTLGEKAELYEKIRYAINMCKCHVATGKEVEKMFHRLSEKIMKDVRQMK